MTPVRRRGIQINYKKKCFFLHIAIKTAAMSGKNILVFKKIHLFIHAADMAFAPGLVMAVAFPGLP